MKFIIRRALSSLFLIAVGAFSIYVGFDFFDLQTREAIETQSVEWFYAFTGAALIAAGLMFICIGVMISSPRNIRRVRRWMD